MDALKKAETDKLKQHQPTEEINTSDAAESIEPLSLALSDQADELDGLPNSDVVDDPQIQPQKPPQEALQREQPSPELQQTVQPEATAFKQIKRRQNTQRYYIIAAAMSVIAILISGYFYWRLNNVNQTVVYSPPDISEKQTLSAAISTSPADTTTASTTRLAPPAAQSKRAEPISQEAAYAPTPAPEATVTEKPIKIKKNTSSRKNSQTLLKAYQAYSRGDLATAKTLYEKILTRLPRNRDAMLGLAAIALNAGNTGHARQYYQQILALNPVDPAARTALLDLNGVDTLHRDASQIKHWLQTNNEDAAMQFVLGNRYAQAEQWSKAQQAYFQAHKNSPDNADYAFNLAVSLEQLNKSTLAIKYYRIAQQNAVQQKSNFSHEILQQRLELLQAAHAGAAS